jgi:hypothetical protein
MLKRYKNAFFEVIQAAGLDVRDFMAEEKGPPAFDGPAFSIHYKPANLTFIAWNSSMGPHTFKCSLTSYAPPGFRLEPKFIQYPDKGKDFVDFKEVRRVFDVWLSSQVRLAIDEELLPDLWAAASEDLATIESHPISSVTEFTEEERQQLKLALSTFRLLVIETFRPDEEQLKVISQQVDYLVGAVDRLNKFDWKGVALSTLIGITTALSLDTERGRQLYGLFQQAFSALLHLLR